MIKILIVEDEEPIANLIRMNLVKAGYQCETASDGETAADLIQELIEKGSLAVAGSRQAVERAARLFERTEHLHS